MVKYTNNKKKLIPFTMFGLALPLNYKKKFEQFVVMQFKKIFKTFHIH